MRWSSCITAARPVADDPLDTISGTAVSRRGGYRTDPDPRKGRADGNLYVRGRDVPEADYALGFDPVTCTWNLLGDAAEYRLTEDRADVVTLLAARGPLTPKDIADALGAEPWEHPSPTPSDEERRAKCWSATAVTRRRVTCNRCNTPGKLAQPMPNSLLHPLLHREGCNTPCNRETAITMPIFDPVTRVTEEAGDDRWTR